MTDPNYTALLFVIDRSGSMASIRDEMVGGLNAVLAAQAAEPGLTTVDVVSFDNLIEYEHRFAAPGEFAITLEPRGGTALYDAVGFAISEFGTALAALPELARPGVVQVVVVTDGEENSSREWRSGTVRAAITRQREQYGWDFTFLGANQDAVLTARTMGIDPAQALSYDASDAAVPLAAAALNGNLLRTRRGDRSGYTDDDRGAAKGR